MRYRFILLDADNTLFDFDACEKEAFFRTVRDFAANPTEAMYRRYSELNLACWKALERGEITREELKIRRFAQLRQEYPLSATPEELCEHYVTHLSMQSILYPGAVEFVRELASMADVYIVTNGLATVQEGRFRDCPLLAHLKDVFISEKIGAQKPDKLFFDRVTERIEGFDPRAAIVIGDSLTSDIKGANNAGIDCIWYNPKGLLAGNEKIDHEVSDYGQILAILKRGDIHEN